MELVKHATWMKVDPRQIIGRLIINKQLLSHVRQWQWIKYLLKQKQVTIKITLEFDYVDVHFSQSNKHHEYLNLMATSFSMLMPNLVS